MSFADSPIADIIKRYGELIRLKPEYQEKEPPANLKPEEKKTWLEKEKEEFEIRLSAWSEEFDPVSEIQGKIINSYAISLGKIYHWLSVSQLFDYFPSTTVGDQSNGGVFCEEGVNPLLAFHRATEPIKLGLVPDDRNFDFEKRRQVVARVDKIIADFFHERPGKRALEWLKEHHADSLVPVTIPKPTDETPIIVVAGQAAGGKTTILSHILWQIYLGNMTGHGLGAKIDKADYRYVVARIEPAQDKTFKPPLEEKERPLSSYESEIMTRINDIVEQIKKNGPGGLILLDAPLEKYTNHEEAKYLLEALMLFIQENGCHAVITSHITELFGLSDKLNSSSRLKYLPVSVTDPYGERPFQYRGGEKGRSYGIETTAHVPNFPPEIIERARHFREEIEKAHIA